MLGWQLEDIPWERFDPKRASRAHLPLVKAASLVEANAADYRDYLCNVFADDTRMCQQFANWAVEEQKHGAALAQWASRMDPDFEFDKAFEEFREGFHIDIEADSSVRGSQTGEMLARCMVETGTNSFYTALSRSTDEPVLRYICEKIAEDEMAHYWLFHRQMTRFLEAENLTFFDRLKIAYSRIAETEDDELAYAWYSANKADEPYNRRWHGGAYHSQALAYYTPSVIRDSVRMICGALGIDPSSVAGYLATGVIYLALRFHRLSSLCQVAYFTCARSLSRISENSRTAFS